MSTNHPRTLNLRAYCGAEDAEGMAQVRQACAAADGVDPRSVAQKAPNAAELRLDLVSEDGFDASQDVQIAEVDDNIVGYSAVRWWTESDGTRLFLTLGWVAPEWRRRGIGTELLHWAEARCRVLARSNPGPGPTYYGGNASDTEHDSAELLLNEGYRVFFTVLEMALEDWSDLPDPALPQGFDARPLTPQDLPALFDSVNGCYSDHPFSDGMNYPAWAARQVALSSWQVAWDKASGQIAGQVQTLARNGKPEVEEVSVRSPFRRRGLARALIARGLLSLKAQGAELPRLRTLLENPQQAWRVYESVGFRVVKRFPRYRKPL